MIEGIERKSGERVVRLSMRNPRVSERKGQLMPSIYAERDEVVELIDEVRDKLWG